MKRTFILRAVLAAALSGLLLSGCHRVDRPNNVIDYSTFDGIDMKSFDASMLVPEETYVETMKNTVEPYLDARMTEDYLDCKSGNKIHYEAFKADNPKGLIVIVHGFCEFTKKYNEMSYYYLNRNYDVVRFDLQGHGYSTRHDENKSKASLISFDSYMEDMNDIIENVAKPLANGVPLYLYAHSLGGGIATNYLETYPGVFKKAILNCPMHAINTHGLGENLTLTICNIMYMLKKKNNYIPGNHDYVPEADYIHEEFDARETACGARKNYYNSYRRNDEHYQVFGATYKWTKECMKGTRRIRSRKFSQKVQIPVLLFQAGNDSWVKAFGHFSFRRGHENVTIEFFPQLRHEIYSSQNKYLAPYYNEVFKFFEAE